MTSLALAAARVRQPIAWLAAMAAGLVALTAAGPTLHHAGGEWALLLVFAIGGAGILAALRIADGADPARCPDRHPRRRASLMRLALLFVEPYLSTDIYRYVWDGRVQAAGINPYRYMPIAPEVSHLRDAAIFPNINRADYAVTIYPPAAQAIFLAVTRLGESVVAMKLGLLAFEVATIALLLALLHRLGSPPTRIVAYAWHPLPIWEIAGNGHVDIAMCALLMAGLLLFLHGRTLLAGVAVTLGALVKPTALLALPVFWRPWNWRLPLVVVLTAVLAYVPYLSVGSGVLGYLWGYVEEEGLASGSRVQRAVADGAVHRADAGRGRALHRDRRPRHDRPRDRGRPSARTGLPQASIACLSWLLVIFLVLVVSALSLVLPGAGPVPRDPPVRDRLGAHARLPAPLRRRRRGRAGRATTLRIAAFTLATARRPCPRRVELRRKSETRTAGAIP